jgi:biopolymer transport protein ExbD
MTLPTKRVGDDRTALASSRAPGRPCKKPRMQPPLTPMIDVTFQLLLFFLLACEFRESEGRIPGTLPTVPTGRWVEPITVTLCRSSVDASAYYRLNGLREPVTSPQQLYERLRERQAALGSRDVPVVIRPNGNVSWEFVVEAFNQAVRAEFTKIAFARDDLAMLSSP